MSYTDAQQNQPWGYQGWAHNVSQNPNTMHYDDHGVRGIRGGPSQLPQQQQAPQTQAWDYIDANQHQTTPQLTDMDYMQNMLGLLNPVAGMDSYGQYGGGSPQQAAGGGQQAPQQNMNVQAGITPQYITQPSMGTPQMAGLSPMAGSGYDAQLAAQQAPMQQQLMAQYYPAQAGLQQAFQQAQANSGLGWGGLGSQALQAQQGYQTGMQNNLLGLLGGLT